MESRSSSRQRWSHRRCRREAIRVEGSSPATAASNIAASVVIPHAQAVYVGANAREATGDGHGPTPGGRMAARLGPPPGRRVLGISDARRSGRDCATGPGTLGLLKNVADASKVGDAAWALACIVAAANVSAARSDGVGVQTPGGRVSTSSNTDSRRRAADFQRVFVLWSGKRNRRSLTSQQTGSATLAATTTIALLRSAVGVGR